MISGPAFADQLVAVDAMTVSNSRSLACASAASARGEVGDANPLLTIGDALANFPATEIVIVTHPPGQSDWLEHRLVERATSRFNLPITHLVSTHGLVPKGIAA